MTHYLLELLKCTVLLLYITLHSYYTFVHFSTQFESCLNTGSSNIVQWDGHCTSAECGLDTTKPNNEIKRTLFYVLYCYNLLFPKVLYTGSVLEHSRLKSI